MSVLSHKFGLNAKYVRTNCSIYSIFCLVLKLRRVTTSFVSTLPLLRFSHFRTIGQIQQSYGESSCLAPLPQVTPQERSAYGSASSGESLLEH